MTRWERGTAVPSPHYVRLLCEVFGKTPQQLGLLVEEAKESRDIDQVPPLPASTYWNVPYRRNPFFTGRKEILSGLHEQFMAAHAVAISQSYALTGMGGVGKTQIAIEYAYSYRDAYRAVFWVRAASRDSLITDFVALARLIELPGCDGQDQNQIVVAAKRWLTHHQGWLLILDNADELSLVADFMPEGGSGRILLTTQAQATGKLAPCVFVDKMEPEEACLFLLRRSKMLAAGMTLEEASEEAIELGLAIVYELDGLPLALDQAGAYIEETGCSLEEYRALYHRGRTRLLQRQSEVFAEYPYTVASTWSLSFQRVEVANPAAAELLCLCAFLDADSIPETLLVAGAAMLGPVLGPVAADAFLLNEALQVLRRYSLVRRHAETKTISIHRLVQSVIKSRMSEESRRSWAERTVKAVNAAFPDRTPDDWPQLADWQRSQELLPHVNSCAELIELYDLVATEAGQLLTDAGSYQWERGHYGPAEKLLQQALTIREQLPEEKQPDLATTLDMLGSFYGYEGKYEQAEMLLGRALAIRERWLGEEHRHTAVTLSHLGLVFALAGKYEQAEGLLERALAFGKEFPESPLTVETLDNLARLKYFQGQYERSEELVTRALDILEGVRGSEHPDTAVLRANLAYLSRFQGKYEKAERLCLQALRVTEQMWGPEHSDVAFGLDNLASLYQLQGKYEQAKPLYQRALAIREKAWGELHTEIAGTLDNLALVCRAQGSYEEAESLHQRALSIRERVSGPEHPDTVETLHHLATLYLLQHDYRQAEQLYQKVLGIRKRVLGEQHPETARTLYGLARLWHMRGQLEQARGLYQEALSIWEQKLGAAHPDTGEVREALQRAEQGLPLKVR